MRRRKKDKKKKQGIIVRSLKWFLKGVLKLVVFAGVFVAIIGYTNSKGDQKNTNGNAVSEAIGIPYEVQTLPISNKRPGIKRQIKYIVVHNTANETSTAQNERDYLSNDHNNNSTSWHIVVDDTEAIEAVPLTEVAFHAGTRLGNQQGIGIEICESGNFKKTKKNAVKLIAYLMKEYNIPLENVKTHKDFSGKECPRKLLDDWEDFKDDIEAAYEA